MNFDKLSGLTRFITELLIDDNNIYPCGLHLRHWAKCLINVNDTYPFKHDWLNIADQLIVLDQVLQEE